MGGMRFGGRWSFRRPCSRSGAFSPYHHRRNFFAKRGDPIHDHRYRENIPKKQSKRPQGILFLHAIPHAFGSVVAQGIFSPQHSPNGVGGLIIKSLTKTTWNPVRNQRSPGEKFFPALSVGFSNLFQGQLSSPKRVLY